MAAILAGVARLDGKIKKGLTNVEPFATIKF